MALESSQACAAAHLVQVTVDGKKGLHGRPRLERLLREALVEFAARQLAASAVPSPPSRSRAAASSSSAPPPPPTPPAWEPRRAYELSHVLPGLQKAISAATKAAEKTSRARGGDHGEMERKEELAAAVKAEEAAKTEGEKAALATKTAQARVALAAASDAKEVRTCCCHDTLLST